jgi:hypothetical protein
MAYLLTVSDQWLASEFIRAENELPHSRGGTLTARELRLWKAELWLEMQRRGRTRARR